jgi:hypothetical protein
MRKKERRRVANEEQGDADQDSRPELQEDSGPANFFPSQLGEY